MRGPAKASVIVVIRFRLEGTAIDRATTTIADRVFTLYPLGLRYSGASSEYCPSGVSMTSCGAYLRIGAVLLHLSRIRGTREGRVTTSHTYDGFTIVQVVRKDGAVSEVLVDLLGLAFSDNSGKTWQRLSGDLKRPVISGR